MSLSAETKYQLILEISQKVRDTLDLDVILNQILDLVQTVVPYDAGGVFVLRQDVAPGPYGPPQHLIAGIARRGFTLSPEDEDPMYTEGKGIIGRVIQTNQAVIVPDVHQNQYYIPGRQQTASEIAVPVFSHDRVIGALNLESDRLGAFDETDLQVLRFFADAAAISIEKAMLHMQIIEKERLEAQLRTACEVQSRLLPDGSPGIPNYDIGGVCIPTEQVGGDYFDYITLPYQKLGVVVGDVSGHGISAALVMTAFRALLRTHVHSYPNPSRIAAAINHQLPEFTGDQHFVSAFYLNLNIVDGSFEYVNGGNPPALLLRTDGSYNILDVSGPVMGMLEDQEYPLGRGSLAVGEMLVLFTDGVVEVGDTNGQRFGLERLVKELNTNHDLPVAALTERVIQRTREFSGQTAFEDDFTLVLIRRI